MSAEQPDPEDLTQEDIQSVQDAANLLGIPVTATAEEVAQGFQDNSVRYHPDGEGTTESFKALTKARDIMEAQARRMGDTGAEPEPGREEAPESPGTGGWGPEAAEKQEEYQDLVRRLKIHIVEQVIGVEIVADSLGDAVRTGEISRQRVSEVENVLRQNYGVPELTIEDVARVIAALIVQGAADLGMADRFAGQQGAFGGKGGGAFGRGGSYGAFGRGPGTRRR